MKRVKAIILALILVAIPSTALAQFSLGVRAGVAINNITFSKDVLSADNTAGFTGGLTAEMLSSSLGLGFDASLLYRYSGSTISFGDIIDQYSDGGSYLDIPINLKWKINIPATEKLLSPILFTGPSFSFRLNSEDGSIKELWKAKRFNTAWSFGGGVELVDKIQVTVAYSLALSDSFDFIIPKLSEANGKNNYWTISAAYMF